MDENGDDPSSLNLQGCTSGGMDCKHTLLPETGRNMENEQTNLKRLHEIENCVSRSYNVGRAVFRHVRESRRDATPRVISAAVSDPNFGKEPFIAYLSPEGVRLVSFHIV